MRAVEVREHFRGVGTWVDWDHTCDEFLHGDPNIEVQGMAVAWIPTNAAIDRAASAGCNLFVTHEPAFYGGYRGCPSADTLAEQKRAMLDDYGMTLLRCHDTWDRMPDVGVVDAWAAFLGFPTQPRMMGSFYRVCLTGGLPLVSLAERVRNEVAELGQDAVLILGDPDRPVNRLAVGTGAITHLPSMYDLGVDAILATDDGINFWDGGLWAVDIAVPLLIVNHATAEKPGMMALARYLRDVFPNTPVEYIDIEMPYKHV